MFYLLRVLVVHWLLPPARFFLWFILLKIFKGPFFVLNLAIQVYIKIVSIVNLWIWMSEIFTKNNQHLHSFFYKNQQNLRTKAFIFAIRTKIRTKKGFIFLLRNISVLNEAFSFYSFKILRLLKALRTFWFLM